MFQLRIVAFSPIWDASECVGALGPQYPYQTADRNPWRHLTQNANPILLEPSSSLRQTGLLSAGDGPSSPETPTTLAVSPQELRFSDATPQHTVFVSTSPSGGRRTGPSRQSRRGLEVTPTNGRINRETVQIQLAPPLAGPVLAAAAGGRRP
jgi:hypothetical protein